ncbi:MAG: response regulator [Planctomycetota bacterium]
MTRVLLVNGDGPQRPMAPDALPDDVEITGCRTLADAVSKLREDRHDVIYWQIAHESPDPLSCLIQSHEILEQLSDGVALLDKQHKIVKANQRLARWFKNHDMAGLDFYEAIGSPDIIGHEASPLGTATARRKSCSATLQIGDRYFDLKVAPFVPAGAEEDELFLVVSMRDATDSVLQRQKLDALRKAGMALADLRPEEIFDMDVPCRIDLLKDNILHYTNDLLDFDVVEIRLLDRTTNLLEQLLSVGINAERASQPLYAEAEDNGVTGFVGATGTSYMCEDTASDPLYVDGLIGARSSLTVPLIYNDEVIGTFNVESPDISAFTELDVQYVESFARDIAVAVNKLELLAAQQTTAAQKSVEAIHGAVAIPVDEILNDTVQVIESYIGHDPDVVKRLRSILRNARDIKQVIQKVGETLAPADAVPAGIQRSPRHPALKDKRVLVIDSDTEVRTSAHSLLEKFGCIVETAHEGKEAILMVRNCGPDDAYDAIIADIRLPDISGYELLIQLKDLIEQPPMILMTGFGYDPGHSIVKARKAGLRAGAVLYKPFRLDQLLSIVELIVQPEEQNS